MDILESSKAWAKQEQAIAEALKAYRRKKRADRKPLILLFDRYERSMPKSLYRGIRDILAGKRGAPSKLTASERMSRITMGFWVKILCADGWKLEDACLEVAELFDVSDSKVKHAYRALLRSSRSGKSSVH